MEGCGVSFMSSVYDLKSTFVIVRLCPIPRYTWWSHEMETFSALLAFCVENSPVTGEFPAQSPVTWSFDVFFWSALE